MSNTTELLLKKYYGFGVNRENNEFLPTFEATCDSCKLLRRVEIPIKTKTEEIGETLGPSGASSEVSKDSVNKSDRKFSTSEKIIRSSRAIIDEEDLEDAESDHYEYEALMEPMLLQHEKDTNENFKIQEPMTLKIEKTDDANFLSLDNDDDPLMKNFEQISEHRLEKSPIITTRKTRKKSALTACSIVPQPVKISKKLSSCNGIFLDLANLSLIEFPVKIISTVPHLRMLYLEKNSLRVLPDEIFTSLRVLQWLDVRNNKLKALPKTIKHHPSLETILLDENLLEELPLELCLLPNLKELQTARNPLTYPPADIMALGFTATINFLRLAWNKNNPEEILESLNSGEKKITPSTILCADPPVLQTMQKRSDILGSSSSGQIGEGMKKISVRQKARNYRPSNRCGNKGPNEHLEMRLLWIAQIKEMLTKRTMALQKIKDRDALNEWRRDRRSYDKSMKRAKNRTQDDIPFALDLEDGIRMKSSLKMPLKKLQLNKHDVLRLTNIDRKMNELYESLNQLENKRNSEELSPRTEQKLLESQMKKLSDMHEQIQNLQRRNEATTAPFEASRFLPDIDLYARPPSIII